MNTIKEIKKLTAIVVLTAICCIGAGDFVGRMVTDQFRTATTNIATVKKEKKEKPEVTKKAADKKEEVKKEEPKTEEQKDSSEQGTVQVNLKTGEATYHAPVQEQTPAQQVPAKSVTSNTNTSSTEQAPTQPAEVQTPQPEPSQDDSGEEVGVHQTPIIVVDEITELN